LYILVFISLNLCSYSTQTEPKIKRNNIERFSYQSLSGAGTLTGLQLKT
jgi:hypothetical protein